MKTIYVGFSKSKKLLPIGSWLVRLYQGTNFSHTYIRLTTKKFPSDKILHASEGKVQNMSETQFNLRHEIVEEFPVYVNDFEYRKIVEEMHELSGADYSIWQNIGILWVHLLRFMGKRVSNPFQDGWNCSEYVVYILKKAYSEHLKHIDPNTVTPEELYIILKELSGENTN